MSVEDVICYQQKKPLGEGQNIDHFPKKNQNFLIQERNRDQKWKQWVLDIKWTDGDMFLFHLSALIP